MTEKSVNDSLVLRKIKIRVFNNIKQPMKEKIIRKTVKKVFREYRKKTGIKFIFDGIKPFNMALESSLRNAWLGNISIYLKAICQPDVKMKIIFSDEVYQKEDGKICLGEAFPLYELALIFNPDHHKSVPLTDAGGNPIIITCLKHEIGHLLGLYHSECKESFMYPYCSRSYGRWTTDITETLKRYY